MVLTLSVGQAFYFCAVRWVQEAGQDRAEPPSQERVSQSDAEREGPGHTFHNNERNQSDRR